jgi:hypothetical protein
MAQFVSCVYLLLLYLFLPVMPLLASMVFVRLKYVAQYQTTLKKCVIHIRALGEGPARHYFSEVAGLSNQVPEEISGSCIQCGNCCMERRCLFIEPNGDNIYNCGIYHSIWRRFSNCGSFPLNRHDIERYACPSYYLGTEQPIVFLEKRHQSMPSELAAPASKGGSEEVFFKVNR